MWVVGGGCWVVCGVWWYTGWPFSVSSPCLEYLPLHDLPRPSHPLTTTQAVPGSVISTVRSAESSSVSVWSSCSLPAAAAAWTWLPPVVRVSCIGTVARMSKCGRHMEG